MLECLLDDGPRNWIFFLQEHPKAAILDGSLS
jgi:hypothetical protein